MNKNILKLIISILVTMLIISCLLPPEDDYVELELINYFKLDHETIAKKLARQLDIMPITFKGMTYFSFMGDDNLLTPYTGHQWIKEGYHYTTSDSANIVVWTDSLDQVFQVQYLFMRLGAADHCVEEKEEIETNITRILKNLGIDVKQHASYESRLANGRINHWYDFEARQIFNADTIGYPWIQVEGEGDNSKINFMQIRRWYKNLDEIKYTLPDSTLKSIARDYYSSCEDVISMPDSITVYGSSIIHNKLCKVLGAGIIDRWNSYILLYIDAQDGSIVEAEYVYYR